MSGRKKAPVVITVHGIMSRGKWQKNVADVLANCSYALSSYDNFVDLINFLIPFLRNRNLKKFKTHYNQLINDKNLTDRITKDQFPHVIAHSFGTYIIGYCLIKYPEIKFDKVILCGSILPRHFDWDSLIHSGQVKRIKNEYSKNDFWSKIVKKFARKLTGSSGYDKFISNSNFLQQDEFNFYSHSDYLNTDHIRNQWLPFLKSKSRKFYIQHGNDIVSETEFKRIFNKTIELDKLSFGDCKNYKLVEVDIEQAIKWTEVCKDIYTFLFSQNNSVVGYINAMPLKQSIFNKLKNGEINDNDITSNDIVPFDQHKDIKLYIMSIVIDKSVRKQYSKLYNEPFEVLFSSFLIKILKLLEKHNNYIAELIAVGWTKSGQNLCNHFGMQPLKYDRFKNPIFYLDLKNKMYSTESVHYPLINQIKRKTPQNN